MRRAEKGIDCAGRQESDVLGDLLAGGAVRRFYLWPRWAKVVQFTVQRTNPVQSLKTSGGER
jgi:hypothetical protein